MISRDVLVPALREFLPRQRWFAGQAGELEQLEIAAIEVIHKDWPVLVHLLVDVTVAGRKATYQVVLGLRPDAGERFFEGKADALIGELPTDMGEAFVYDAVIDPVLSLCLLEHVAPAERVERARMLTSEQTNSSIVYDERLILKLYRRLADGPNPDAEVTRALAAVGFDHVAPPIAEWRGDNTHYAVVNEFLVGATEGQQLAITSLRDLYDRRCDPAEAGGDFAPEANRLGGITARMHVALGEAFGTAPGDAAAWAADMERQLQRVGDAVPAARVREVYERFERTADAGAAIRIHGDYHLGQVVRTDTGWYVLDFEGEPARPVDERRRPSSPLRDVAGMLRSLDYATQIALAEFGIEADDELMDLGREWEERNSAAFVAGYTAVDGVDRLLPGDEQNRALLLDVFQLDKAVYEVAYEQGHRPDWVGIPIDAVNRILERAF